MHACALRFRLKIIKLSSSRFCKEKESLASAVAAALTTHRQPAVEVLSRYSDLVPKEAVMVAIVPKCDLMVAVGRLQLLIHSLDSIDVRRLGKTSNTFN